MRSGKTNALTLTSAQLIDHVRSRRAKGAGPATVANDLVWLGVVLQGCQERQGSFLSGLRSSKRHAKPARNCA